MKRQAGTSCGRHLVQVRDVECLGAGPSRALTMLLKRLRALGPLCKAWPAPQSPEPTTTACSRLSCGSSVSCVQPTASSIAAADGLTPRSKGAPTAGHQARAGGTRYIFTGPGLASCRRRPLTSNVRPRLPADAALLISARPSGLALLVHPPLRQTLLRGALQASTLRELRFTRHHLVGRSCQTSLFASKKKIAVNSGSSQPSPAWPNPLVKRTRSGMPPGPGWRYAVHFRHPGPGVTPPRSAYLQR